MTDGSVFAEYAGFTVEYRDASHRYWLHVDGKRKPAVSVTSALKVIERPALLFWAEKCGAEGAARLAKMGELNDVPPEDAIGLVRLHKLGMDAKRDAGADRGTVVHRVLEVYSRDGTVPNVNDFEPEIRGYVQGLCGWLLKASPVPVAIETVVGSALHGYAGRFDLLATIGAFTFLVDLKTSPKGRVYDEAHLQTVAYLMALDECGFDHDGALLVSVGEDGRFEQLPCDAEENDFLGVLELSRTMTRLRSLRTARERETVAA